jgi:mono/diheme cytochrome c family protein
MTEPPRRFPLLTKDEARRIAVNIARAGAAGEGRTCGLSSRARQNLHRFRAGTTAGREIGDRAKIPARDYARGSPIGQPSSTIRTINTNNSDCRRDQHAVTEPIREGAPAVGVDQVPCPTIIAHTLGGRDRGGQGIGPARGLCGLQDAGGVGTLVEDGMEIFYRPCRTEEAGARSRLDAYRVIAGAGLLFCTSAFAQDAAAVAAGESAWDKAGCLQCHGASGQGGDGGEFPAGPSLQKTRLDRAALVETISCGLPGTQMPAWLDGAYTKRSCYGFPLGSAPAEITLTPVLSAVEIEALVDYLMAKIVGR